MTPADLAMACACALVIVVLLARAAHERRRRRGPLRPPIYLVPQPGQPLREGPNRKRSTN